MKIIAFSGKKQSGKTTVTSYLYARTKAPEVINFADVLKRIVKEYFIDPLAKEAVIRSTTDIASFEIEGYKNTIHSCGKTYRELLQIIGTDYFRYIWPEIWIENYKKRLKLCEIENWAETIITADIRFPNEVKCIQELGGHVIRLLRNPHDDKHESETALDGIETETMLTYEFPSYAPIKQTPRDPNKIYFDAIIDNREMSIEQQNKAVWKLVNEKGWI